MYVFNALEKSALQHADPTTAVVVERLVECASSNTEPEWCPEFVDEIGLGRWLIRIAERPGIDSTKNQLRRHLQAISPTWTSQIAECMAGRPASLHQALSAYHRQRTQQCLAELSAGLDANDPDGAMVPCPTLVNLWHKNLIDTRTIHKKLTGLVLDPQHQQTNSTVRDRLIQAVQDLSTRVPQPHSVTSSAEIVNRLPMDRLGPTAAAEGVAVSLAADNARRIVLTAEVQASDPLFAAHVGRQKFIECVRRWTQNAPKAVAAAFTDLAVTMPNGESVPIRLRSFAIAQPRMVVRNSDLSNAVPEFSPLRSDLYAARERIAEGDLTGALTQLWSVSESLVRLSTEKWPSPDAFAERLSCSFLTYFALRQAVLMGRYFSEAKSTKPRTKFPIKSFDFANKIRSGEIKTRVLGNEWLAKQRLAFVSALLTDNAVLLNELLGLKARISRALLSLRVFRNAYIHGQIVLADDIEAAYLAKWVMTLIDQTLGDALRLSGSKSFSLDSHFAARVSVWNDFKQLLESGKVPFVRLCNPMIARGRQPASFSPSQDWSL